MIIWIITVGEPLPMDGEGTRLFRSSILTNFLVKRGHKVVRWSTTFNHVTKSFRYNENTNIIINENYTIKLLHSISYSTNISLKRLVNHYFLAKEFQKAALKYDKSTLPDLIVCSFPTIQLAKAATAFGLKNNIPVVLDARDMWPDIFLDAFPRIVRPIFKALAYPLFNSTHKAFSQATIITGITQSFVKWGLEHAKREMTEKDIAFPLGYLENDYTKSEIKEADNYWDSLNINGNSEKMYVCLVGSLTHGVNFDVILESAAILKTTNKNIEFIIAGKGINEKEFKIRSENYPNIRFVGWINGPQIWSLLRRVSLGLLPYIDRLDYQMSIPNKVGEYLSASLPIITTLKGVSTELMIKAKCGFYVNNAAELVDVLNKFHQDKTLSEISSSNALKTYQKTLNAHTVYTNYANHLENIITLKAITPNSVKKT
jgi:glycosyltransferase involved in cell wall biosynthesis